MSRDLRGDVDGSVAARIPDWLPNVEHWFDELDEAGEEVQLSAGLAIDGDYAIDASFLIVDGDLRVSGPLSDCLSGTTRLLVIGDVQCNSFDARGAITVTGNVHVEEYVFVNSGNDYSFVVGGELVAQVFVGAGTSSYAKRMNTKVFALANTVGEGDPRHSRIVIGASSPADGRGQRRGS